MASELEVPTLMVLTSEMEMQMSSSHIPSAGVLTLVLLCFFPEPGAFRGGAP